MPMSPLLKTGAAALLAIGLAGCFGGAKAPPELLTLTATDAPAAGATRSATRGESVAVLSPTVPRALSANRIAVYVSPTSIQYLTNAVWADQPKELFRNLLAEVIAARTGRLVLDPNNFAEPEGVTLSGQLLQFGLEPSRMEVVVTYEAALSRGPRSLQTQRFEARVPVTAQTSAAVVPALNQAANQLAGQVADWIGR